LYWDSGTSAYTPYSGRTAGKFYTGFTLPISSNRLNYDGDLYVMRLNAYQDLRVGTTTTYFNSDGNFISMNDSTGNKLSFQPNITNGVGVTVYTLDTSNVISAANSKLLEIKNSGVTKFYVDSSGNTISANTRKITLFDITSGSTSYWNMNSGCTARLYLTGATTLSISNTVSGDNGTLIVIQGTSGNITFPSGSKYPGGTPPTLSGSGQLDIFSFYYDGTSYYWNIGKNYA
jgi:hypothetical protein